MPAPKIRDDVRRFIGEHIDSVAQLDVLLLLRAAPDKRWSPEEVARALVTRPPAAAGFLAQLETSRLLVREDDVYRYAPAADTAPTIDGLAEAYATRRTSVVSLIFEGPDDAVSSLADAFKLRRRKD